MSVHGAAPLALAAALALTVALSRISVRVDRVLSRISLRLFGEYVHSRRRKRATRADRLRRAYLATTYRSYAAETLLYAAIGAIVGGILGAYAGRSAPALLATSPEAARETLPGPLEFAAGAFGTAPPSSTGAVAAVLVGAAALGLASGAAVYWLRWWYPARLARARRRKIEANLPQAVAFMYALSRSGMAFPEVLRILSDHRNVYGEPAAEAGVAVRSMDLFGTDMITAVKAMGRRTPSRQFAEFAENLASVLQSGRSLPEFLEQQHEQFREEAEIQQERLLDRVATLAEIYVTVLVAGPLFLITILIVVGIAMTDTLPILRAVVYVALPAANLAFVAYLTAVIGESGGGEGVDDLRGPLSAVGDVRRADDPAARPDGGRAGTARGAAIDGDADAERRTANLERLALYGRVRWLRDRLGDPVRTVLERPTALLWVTVPFAVAATAIRLYWAVSLGVPLRAVADDLLVQAALFVVGTFAIVHEIHRRRVETVEAAVPDLLDRLASVNEAGMTIVESVDRVRGSDLGALDAELDRMWADVRWGADVETALRRFEARIRTRTVSRVVTLVTNAMNASGDLARVLRIAAGQATADRRLKRARRQEMLTYVVVVYVAFGVFLVIIAALDTVLIPNLPDDAALPQTTGAAGQFGAMGAIADAGSFDESAYTLIFFHATVIQGLCSGLIAGQMSHGSLRDGAKHATVLLAVAYLTFLLL